MNFINLDLNQIEEHTVDITLILFQHGLILNLQNLKNNLKYHIMKKNRKRTDTKSIVKASSTLNTERKDKITFKVIYFKVMIKTYRVNPFK